MNFSLRLSPDTRVVIANYTAPGAFLAYLCCESRGLGQNVPCAEPAISGSSVSTFDSPARHSTIGTLAAVDIERGLGRAGSW
jgi:hypothetical protein